MKIYAAKHKEKEIINDSRSGGVFTALSDVVLNEGKVYGCILDEDFNAVHIGTSDKNVRDKMRGSKYVQSNLKDCFRSLKNDLDNNE